MVPVFRRILVVALIALAAGVGGVTLGSFVSEGLAGWKRSDRLAAMETGSLDYGETDIVKPRWTRAGPAPTHYECTGCDSHVPGVLGWNDAFEPFEIAPMPFYDPERDDPLVDWPDVPGVVPARSVTAGVGAADPSPAARAVRDVALSGPEDEDDREVGAADIAGPVDDADLMPGPIAAPALGPVSNSEGPMISPPQDVEPPGASGNSGFDTDGVSQP